MIGNNHLEKSNGGRCTWWGLVGWFFILKIALVLIFVYWGGFCLFLGLGVQNRKSDLLRL